MTGDLRADMAQAIVEERIRAARERSRGRAPRDEVAGALASGGFRGVAPPG